VCNPYDPEFQSKGAAGGSSNTIDLLYELSKGMPANAGMEVKQFDLVGNKLTLKVESPTEGDAERAASAFSALPVLQGAKASPMEAAKGSRKRFTLTSTIGQRKGM
jgi:hypothetical protein